MDAIYFVVSRFGLLDIIFIALSLRIFLKLFFAFFG